MSLLFENRVKIKGWGVGLVKLWESLVTGTTHIFFQIINRPTDIQ
jgi:hypothetical protein